MQFHKWCPFLMRMVSPQIVGLILFCLIEVSSTAIRILPSHDVYSSSLNVFSPNLNRVGKHQRSEDISNFSDNNTSTEAINSYGASNSISNVAANDRNNNSKTEFITRIPIKNKTTTSVWASNERVSNPMVEFPVQSSADVKEISNQSTVSSNSEELMKVLNDFIDADYDSVRTVQSERNLSDILFRMKVTHISRGKSPQATADFVPNVKQILPNFKKVHNVFSNSSTKDSFRERTDLLNNNQSTTRKEFDEDDSSTFHIATKEMDNTTNYNHTVLVDIKPSNYAVLPRILRFPTRTINKVHPPHKYDSRGRNRRLHLQDFKSREGREAYYPVITKVNQTHSSINIFNYTYHISALERGSMFPYDPFNDTELFERDTRIIPFVIPYKDNKTQSSGTVSRNLTIYELLKPRLRSTMPSVHNVSAQDNVTIVAELNSIQTTTLKYNEITHHTGERSISKNKDTSRFFLTYTDSVSNEFDVSDEVQVSPQRSDSVDDVEFILVQRNKSIGSPDMKPAAANTSEGNEAHIYSKEYINRNADISIKINSFQNNSKISHHRNSDSPNVTAENETSKYDPLSKNEMIITEAEREAEDIKFSDSSKIKISEANNSTEDYNSFAIKRSGNETQLNDTDVIRQPKMSDFLNADSTAFKKPKLDPKLFYDYFMKLSTANSSTFDFGIPEFSPGNFYLYPDIYKRKPVLDIAYSRPTPLFEIHTQEVTEDTPIDSTAFDSMRTSIRVSSTFYPNRMQDVTMKFGNRVEPTTLPTIITKDKKLNTKNDEDPDDAEYRDAIDPGFTMEKLAYLLIGTCCGLSILCLCVVVVAIKCRRVIVEKRIKSQFRNRMYQHERMKDASTPWQQQLFDHFMYVHRHPDSSSSSAESCNCRCVTWSLGPRNLDANRPICPPNRNSQYLCGQKKLPFGAASTLRYESMLGRKRPSPEQQAKNEQPNTDSSHENDSLDQDSDSRDSDGQRQCTCIDYTLWPMPPGDVRRGMYGMCPNTRRYDMGECVQHPPVELRSIARDCPPPVTGSNYLDRSEGVVYWSSNEERLI